MPILDKKFQDFVKVNFEGIKDVLKYRQKVMTGAQLIVCASSGIENLKELLLRKQ